MTDAPEPATSRVFISYRREETAYPAGWLYDRLDERFGDAQVFKDVDSIPLGDDFVEAITTAVGLCDVLLALIGDRWVTIADERGQRRLDDPHDFVRLEIEAALARNVRVIPVLVDGARMPRADELPASMAALVRRQALELSPSRFDSDTNRLLRVLASTLAEVHAGQQQVGEVAGPSGGAHASTADSEKRPADSNATGPPPSGIKGSNGGTPTERRPRSMSTAMIAAIAVVVVAVIAAVVAILATNDDDGDDTAAPAGGIEVDQSTVTSPDGLQLDGLDVEVRNDPPLVGDTATVSYTLTNVTDEPIEFAYTFVGARNPDDENRDPEDMNEGVVLAPDETVSAQGRVFLDSAGSWLVWPCYELVGGQFCPNRWQVTTFLVE